MQLPTIIINYNRLSVLKELLKFVRTLPEISHIHILDNKSDYPQLLNYYEELNNVSDITIHRLPNNRWMRNYQFRKHMKWAIQGIVKKDEKFIATDSDLIPYNFTPNDLIPRMNKILDERTDFVKVGVGLRVDDIPDYYPFKKEVQCHINHGLNLTDEDLKNGYYNAPVDTTFSIYRKVEDFGNPLSPALRTTYPYLLKHVDWYIDPNNLNEEFIYYLNTSSYQSTYSESIRNYLDKNNIKWKY